MNLPLIHSKKPKVQNHHHRQHRNIISLATLIIYLQFLHVLFVHGRSLSLTTTNKISQLPTGQHSSDQSEFSSFYFDSCWNTSRVMRDDQYFSRMFTMGEEIPLQFGCSSILLPKYFEFYPYNKKSIYNSELRDKDDKDYELCENVEIWEEQLNVTCQEMLCEMDFSKDGFSNLNSMIQYKTYEETNIVDWINYCQYCKKNNMRKYLENHTCKTK